MGIFLLLIEKWNPDTGAFNLRIKKFNKILKICAKW
jgi:hypothetical protein